MDLALIFDINQDVIQINNDENMKLLGHNLIDIFLKAGRCVRKSKKNYLIFEVALSCSEGGFSVIAFFYPYLVVATSQI